MKIIKRTHTSVTAAKEPSRGVFWLVDDTLLCFPFYEGAEIGVSKSGLTFNHRKLWDEIKPHGVRKPFDYYPRGRVDFNNQGQPIIYMNPNIDESYVSQIKTEFGLRQDPIIKYDHSEHYRCHLDEGYKSDKL